jgi:hypothetical protein
VLGSGLPDIGSADDFLQAQLLQEDPAVMRSSEMRHKLVRTHHRRRADMASLRSSVSETPSRAGRARLLLGRLSAVPIWAASPLLSPARSS